jgi:hypothetical protein
MNKTIAQGLLYGGGVTLLASALGELGAAETWAEVFTPAHVFGFLSALLMAAGALYHPKPGA